MFLVIYITLPISVLYMCGPVVSPGALKPSVGDRTESSWPLVHTSRFSAIFFFSFLFFMYCTLSGVYINNNNNCVIRKREGDMIQCSIRLFGEKISESLIVQLVLFSVYTVILLEEDSLDC